MKTDTSSLTRLLPFLDSLSDSCVLCVGDLMLDRYVYGEVDRISPEAPIPVLRVNDEVSVPGGCGNVARNVTALGGAVELLALVGKDEAGAELIGQLAELPDTSLQLLEDPSRPTTLKTRFVANGQQLLRADRESSHQLSEELENEVVERMKRSAATCSAIILSDYLKGMLSSRVTREAIALGKSLGIKTIVDPKGRDFERYRGAYMVTPNRKELSIACDSPIKNAIDAEKAARMLISQYDFAGVLVKLGSDGVCLVMRDKGEAVHFPAVAREVYDVSGAGDTVAAALALGLAGGLSDEDSAALANVAGAVVVAKTGTATATRDDLARELMRGHALSGEAKVLTPSEAAEASERWSKQGLNVGFTNGVFDLLHPGHISLIRQSKAACDKLIVGINSDASTKRLKGDARPVQTEAARAAVLASLADVDAVAVFGEDTPLELIEAVRPAVLVKGADYKPHEVVGADIVQSYGGKVLLANLVEGQSTTATISRMKPKDRE